MKGHGGLSVENRKTCHLFFYTPQTEEPSSLIRIDNHVYTFPLWERARTHKHTQGMEVVGDLASNSRVGYPG